MKKTLLGSAVVLGLLLLSAGSAGATTGLLQITGWLTSPTNASITVYDPLIGWNSGTYGVGSFTWKFNHITQSSSLYCLDIFHSFSFGQQWMVDVLPIPPDPNPPYNTDEAAWIYQNYGQSHDAVTAQGTQLALWEVSHEQDWLDHYTASDWWKPGDQESGDFYINSVSSAARNKATEILSDVFERPGPLGAHANYYKPVDAHYGQGQIGNIPEPGVLILLGTGLVSVAGATWRRRRR